MTRAVILFGHGSRDPLWRRPMDAVAERLSRLQPGLSVRCAFLELTEPTLERVADELALAGVSAVAILPMFLGAGRHVREDLPTLVDALRQRHPDMLWDLRPPVGEDPRLLDHLADLALRAAGP
ncbi:CbiX/SirB N-terminal domain-containing protein [Ramlibacter sp. AN1015]|uniref:sirohydrochlorin chelatase n=1 Tax=Ramlibacter sp. AN1015 TaxID=3133428 RepID=UPI0030BDB665